MESNEKGKGINMKVVKALQDDDGHWYLIPNPQSEQFLKDLEDEELTDSGEFDKRYSQYMVNDVNTFQLYIEDKEKGLMSYGNIEEERDGIKIDVQLTGKELKKLLSEDWKSVPLWIMKLYDDGKLIARPAYVEIMIDGKWDKLFSEDLLCLFANGDMQIAKKS